MGVNARSDRGLVAGDQRLARYKYDVSRGDWEIIAGRDKVLGTDVAVSERDAWQLGDDVICVGDAIVAPRLAADVVGGGLFAYLGSAIGVLWEFPCQTASRNTKTMWEEEGIGGEGGGGGALQERQRSHCFAGWRHRA